MSTTETIGDRKNKRTPGASAPGVFCLGTFFPFILLHRRRSPPMKRQFRAFQPHFVHHRRTRTIPGPISRPWDSSSLNLIARWIIYHIMNQSSKPGSIFFAPCGGRVKKNLHPKLRFFDNCSLMLVQEAKRSARRSAKAN